jgi:hypothetical protein
MWRRVDWSSVSDVSKARTVSIFSVPTPETEVTASSEKSVAMYQTTRPSSHPEDSNLHSPCRENFISRISGKLYFRDQYPKSVIIRAYSTFIIYDTYWNVILKMAETINRDLPTL